MVEFSLKQVSKKIWHLNFSDSYDLTIHFFRFQEYYESSDMQNKNVQFIDLMENYTKKIGKGTFTYPNDWAGFNIPGEEIFKRYNAGISDINRYDQLMLSIANYIKAKEGTEKYYIIGTSDDDCWKNTTFNHELAHGLFYADEVYKEKMTAYVDSLPDKVKKKIFQVLKKWGYSDSVLVDEAQAYMATGLQDQLDIKSIIEHQGKFKRFFNSYTVGIRKPSDRGFQIATKAAKRKKNESKK